eukprot:Seg2040.7 transcript_id=Seg2040.7/GoldUCD/mRNA.D3Y31 product="Sphingosine-1-phosphate lyase 1" protein_id=Seg2040.7/GoldUCD/D3Y31
MAAEALSNAWEGFLGVVEPHLPDYLHWNEICWTFVYYLAEVRLLIHRNTRGMEHWEIVTNTVLYSFAVFIGLLIFKWLIGWLFFHEKSLKTRILESFFSVVKKIPILKGKIKAELDKSLDEMSQMAFPLPENVNYRKKLPEKPLSEGAIDAEIKTMSNMGKYKWDDGHVSGTVYHGGKDLTTYLTKIYGMFAWSNPLHADIFPDVRKMEAEVVQMCINMFNGNENCCGTMTIGGTESILLACKAYRDRGFSRGIKKPEMICANTAHAAFDKAAHYFGIRIIHIPVDKKTFQLDLKAMKRAINRNTILLVGSCPQYPHGIIDDFEEMSKLAVKYNIGLHVDSCLGGFLVPFMKKAGFDLPLFDFRLPGVSSISADTHKYGYAPKGSSVIMYSSKELRHFQYHVAPNWTGGIYASATIPGSRPGGIIAATWAALMLHGEQGYVECTRKIVKTRQYIERELRKIKGLIIYGSPQVSIVAFSSDQFDIFRLSTALVEKGWNLNPLQFPAGMHLCCTMQTTGAGVADRFISDIKHEVAELMKNPTGATTGVGALYGMAQSIPDRSLVTELARGYLDAYYSTDRLKPPPAKNGAAKNGAAKNGNVKNGSAKH